MIEAGYIAVVVYPFVRCEVSLWDGESTYTKKSWRPGVEFDSDGFGGFDAYANGLGEMLLTVVSVHKPGRYPTRVFYTRKFKDPDGGVFGKGGLRIASIGKFKRLSSGYREEYDLELETAGDE